MHRHGFDTLGRSFPVEGIFPIELALGSDSIPPKLFMMRV